MKRKILPRFLVGFLIFGIFSFIGISVYSDSLITNYYVEKKAKDLVREARVITTLYAYYYYNSTMGISDVKDHLDVVDSYTDTTIWIVSKNGTVIINSDATMDISDIPYFDASDSGTKGYMIGDFYGCFDEDMLSAISAVNTNYSTRGYLIIHYPMSKITENVTELKNMIVLLFLIFYFASFTIILFFLISFYLPLYRVTNGAKEYSEGNFEYQISISGDDEIGYIASILTYMAQELNTLEDYQRNFIANISHDFRSPLTSIKGYVEAIADGTIPPEMQSKYFNTILYETERLTKLTHSLLALNNMDTKKTLLDITTFDINYVIRQTALSFEGTCTKKKISIDLILTGNELFVSADMGKIQQVLYNLLDNAIKFSHDNSTITIETTIKGEKVYISVKDTGIGIPSDSQKKIFERFYKSDLSRGKDKKGIGLGLSIVKEIIQSHDENINVISTEGVGTKFLFTLTKAKSKPKL